MAVTKEFLSNLLACGARVDVIAAAAGVSRGELYRLFGEYGLQPRPGAARKLPPEKKLIELIQRGDHPETIAEVHGVTTSAVHGALRRAGTSAKSIREAMRPKRGAMGFPPELFQTNGEIDLGAAE